jgi:hypothetical protein
VASSRLIELLDALLAAEAEFVVIGGLAAVLHGAPLGAVDLLCEIGEGQDYDWLLPRSELIGRDDRSMRMEAGASGQSRPCQQKSQRWLQRNPRRRMASRGPR